MAKRKKKPKIKFIYFDLGQVIIPIRNRAQIVNEFAKDSDFDADHIRRVFERDHETQGEFWSAVCRVDRGELYPIQFYEEIREILKLHISFDRFVEVWQMMLKVDERFIDLVKRLRTCGIRTGIISDLCLIHHRKEQELFSRDLFDICFLSFVEGCLKMDAKGVIFKRAIRAANLSPEQILFIDDTKGKIDAALKCNLRVFHYQDNFDEFVDFLTSLGINIRLH